MIYAGVVMIVFGSFWGEKLLFHFNSGLFHSTNLITLKSSE